ncbi:hypothetical protein C8R45DRAFT_991692 [Mycena sanguinolenta]|nr:hypothetical protein C8R45DRAFT_991692 [Mycena sanguinolenta]
MYATLHFHLPTCASKGRPQLAVTMLDRLLTNVDVVLYIFAFTDVYTILSLSQVNKFFYSITLAKQLWIPIVRDLVMRGLSDFPADEDLGELSAETLVEEVRRAVAGPHTWLPGSHAAPTIYREAKLVYIDGAGNSSRSRWLPGGRHILVQSGERIGNIYTTFVGFWEMDPIPRREVWSALCVGILEAVAFDFRTGSKVIASLALHDMHGFCSIVLLEADLTTGMSSTLFQLGPTIAWPSRMRISGDYMAWQGAAGDAIIVLINWASGDFIAFESTERRATFELFPGHVLLAYPSSRPSTGCSLHIYSITSLDHLWRPISAFLFEDSNIRSSLEGVPSVVLNVTGNAGIQSSPCTFSVEVTQCPVHSETYDLVVVVQNSVRPSSASRLVSAWRRLRSRDNDTDERPIVWKKTISRYHFGLSSETDSSPPIPQPTLISILRHSIDCEFTLESRYAVCWNGHRRHRNGYGQHRPRQQECHSGRLEIQRLHQAEPNIVALSVPCLDVAQDVEVSNTGAIMVRSDSDIRVFYYL